MNFIFDLDGTLINTENIAIPAIRQLLKDLGYNPNIEKEEILQYIGYTIDDIFYGLLNTKDPEIIEKAIKLLDKYEIEIIEKLPKNEIFFDGAIEVLKTLKNENHTLYILSNCNKKYLNALLEKELNKYIDFPHCSEMYNWAEKDYVLKLITKGKKDFVMIGDRHKDVDAAKKNGILSVGCTYGYALEEVKDADFIIYDIKELLTIKNKIIESAYNTI
ncbi:hypothetical protein XO10_06910 [Marinitoga sp. 1135]|uniref:HAD family hydrolase n=1 Tax=Marinitoga sp. 1135 TaxID=1643333 RepID=UPI001585DF56|nr:hypothetical protein [Marinitoga sp. 1135]